MIESRKTTRRQRDRQFLVIVTLGVCLSFILGLSVGYWESSREIRNMISNESRQQSRTQR
jgi:uncharacterized protein YneF (UPF0154 family)